MSVGRAGSVFWRIRQSEFERDPEKALGPLWGRLTEMEIYPVGQQAPSSTNRATVRPPTDPSGINGAFPVTPPAAVSPQRANYPTAEMASLDGDGTPCETGVTPYGELAKKIDEIPQDKVREALYAGLPANERIEREVLLRSAAHYLGFSKLGSRVRTRLNRAIGAEKRAGRLDTDWVTVWRAHDQQDGAPLEPFSARTSTPLSPPPTPTLHYAQLATTVLDVVRGHLFGLSREKIPAAIAEQLGLERTDQRTLHLIDRAITELAEKGLLTVKGGAVRPT